MNKDNNKQNKVPNKPKNMFTNPLICAKMFTSSPQIFQPQNQNLSQSKFSIDDLQLKQQFNKKSTVKQSVQGQVKVQVQNIVQIQNIVCVKHNKNLSNLFCVECLNYNICRTCISALHSEHEIMQFQSKEQMLSQTKQILLQTLQQTLKDLKSKQNEIKNRTHQITLIRSSLKTLQQDIISIISSLFKEIQTKLLISIQKNNQLFNRDVQVFFTEYNLINDALRQNLMNILDGDISIREFNKTMVVKQAPAGPNFINYKNSLQKYKKIFRDIRNQLNIVKNILEESCQNIVNQDINKVYKAPKNIVLSKFDKYIQNNNYNQKSQKVNPSFMKTLKLLQTNNDKQNLLKLNNGIGIYAQPKLNRKIF